MEVSGLKRLILEAASRGYTVDASGDVISRPVA